MFRLLHCQTEAYSADHKYFSDRTSEIASIGCGSCSSSPRFFAPLAWRDFKVRETERTPRVLTYRIKIKYPFRQIIIILCLKTCFQRSKQSLTERTDRGQSWPNGNGKGRLISLFRTDSYLVLKNTIKIPALDKGE